MPLVNIADPNCPLPEILLLDASVLLELTAAPQHRTGKPQQAVRQFLNRISTEATAGRMLCLAPAITLEECYFKIIQFKYTSDLTLHEQRLKATLGRPRVSWHDLYKDSPQLIRSYLPILRRFREAVLNLPVVIIEPEDLGSPPPALEPRMFHYIEYVPILPKDAYFLAVAERLKAPHIATMDADFHAGLSEFHVYTYISASP